MIIPALIFGDVETSAAVCACRLSRQCPDLFTEKPAFSEIAGRVVIYLYLLWQMSISNPRVGILRLEGSQVVDIVLGLPGKSVVVESHVAMGSLTVSTSASHS